MRAEVKWSWQWRQDHREHNEGRESRARALRGRAHVQANDYRMEALLRRAFRHFET